MRFPLIFLFIGLQFVTSSTVFAQNKSVKKSAKLVKPYHPEDDATAKINALLIRARKENKNVILQAGGNWCVWCLRFDDFRRKTVTSVAKRLAFLAIVSLQMEICARIVQSISQAGLLIVSSGQLLRWASI